MSVGPFRETALRNRSHSNSPTRRSLLVVEVCSAFSRSPASYPDRFATSFQVRGWANGPEVLRFDGLFTRMGKVRHTITILRTRCGGMPASERHPETVVSREVTWGYFPW